MALNFGTVQKTVKILHKHSDFLLFIQVNLYCYIPMPFVIYHLACLNMTHMKQIHANQEIVYM